ncbi:unnamed protein product [Lathyrus sativus]|nr:unnamed protein product [Lathyrus sativus]
MSEKPSPTKLAQIMHKYRNLMCIVLFMLLFGCIIYFGLTLGNNLPMEFAIADASIKQFNLTSNNTLYYNFKVNITARNTNYGHLFANMMMMKAISSYKGNKFAEVDMTPLDPGFMKTIVLKPVVFYGNSFIKLSDQQFIEYDNETRLGIINLDLKLDLESNQYVYCLGLRVPLISNGKLESTFNVTHCTR